jgi:hypothetical protein
MAPVLNFLLSNCTWKAGELTAEFRQPFDIISVFNTDTKKQKAAGSDSNGLEVYFGHSLALSTPSQAQAPAAVALSALHTLCIVGLANRRAAWI